MDKGKIVKFGTVDELTIDKQICEIKTETEVTDEQFEILRKTFELQRDKKLLTLGINSNSDLNNFMDELRKLSVNITNVNQQRTSLEDLFIKSLSKTQD